MTSTKPRIWLILPLAVVLGLLVAGGQAWAAPPPTLEVQTIGLGNVTATGINCGNSHLTCATAYGSSVAVTLKATAGSGWTFDHWDDDAAGPCPGATNPCTLPAWAGDQFVTAVFTTTRSVQLATLTASVSEDTSGASPVAEGTVADPSTDSTFTCPGTCTQQVVAGSTLTMQEAPASGAYFFNQWAGACSGSQQWCSVYLPANRSVTADFVTAGTSTLKVTVDGGGTVSGGGLTCAAGSICTAQEPTNGSFNLTANANSGYTFNGWSGDCAGAQTTCTVDMSQDRDVTATFVQVVPLLLTVNGNGTVSGDNITCGPGPQTCSGTAAPGTTLQFTATPAVAGSTITWSGSPGCDIAAGPICNIVVPAGSDPISVIATFSGGTPVGGGSFVTLGLTVTGDGYVTGSSGTASIYCTAAGGSGCTASVQQGASVILHAVPASGSFADFTTGWGGGSCFGTSLTCTVTMSTSKTVTADFVGDNTTQNLVVSLSGTGTVSGAGLSCKFTGSAGCTSPQAADANVQITATPGPGQTFAGWSGDCTGTSTLCTLKMDTDHNVTATFRPLAPLTSKLDITVNGAGTVTAGTASCVGKSAKKPTSCTVSVHAGTVLELKATPAKGYVFVGWKGACTGTKPCTVAMESDEILAATFVPALSAGTKKPAVAHLRTGFRITISFRAGEAGKLTVTTKPKSATVKKTVKAGAGIVRVTVKKHGRYVVTLSLRSKSGTHTLRYTVRV